MSRPLRFLALVAVLWVGGRAAIQLPRPQTTDRPAPASSGPRPARAVQVPTAVKLPAVLVPGVAPPLSSSSYATRLPAAPSSVRAGAPPSLPQSNPQPAGLRMDVQPTKTDGGGVINVSDPALAPAFIRTAEARGRRWRVDAYAFTRGGGSQGLAPGAQLGGSQAFARVSRQLGRRFLATARVSSALGASGREAALGMGWQPERTLPISFTIERRVAIDSGGRNAWAAFAAGGVDAVMLADKLRLDAYAQAGMVGARSRDGFVDGAARIARTFGPVSVGAGTWGAAQPGAARLDLGPQAATRLQLGQMAVTAVLDWRVRVAGKASPATGVALTVAAGF